MRDEALYDPVNYLSGVNENPRPSRADYISVRPLQLHSPRISSHHSNHSIGHILDIGKVRQLSLLTGQVLIEALSSFDRSWRHWKRWFVRWCSVVSQIVNLALHVERLQ